MLLLSSQLTSVAPTAAPSMSSINNEGHGCVTIALSLPKLISLTGNWPNILAHICSPDFAYVTSILLGSYKLQGRLDPMIGNFQRLQDLNLNLNSVNGTIPSAIFQCTSLLSLQMTDNLLSGAIPTSLGTMTSLLNLDLSRNILNSGIPTELFSFKSVTSLVLPSNNLTGTIPSTFTGLSL